VGQPISHSNTNESVSTYSTQLTQKNQEIKKIPPKFNGH